MLGGSEDYGSSGAVVLRSALAKTDMREGRGEKRERKTEPKSFPTFF